MQYVLYYNIINLIAKAGIVGRKDMGEAYLRPRSYTKLKLARSVSPDCAALVALSFSSIDRGRESPALAFKKAFNHVNAVKH